MSGIDMQFNENSSVQDENKKYKDQDQIPQNSNAERTCIWNHGGLSYDFKQTYQVCRMQK